jgi:hypothetical protein
MRYFHTKNIKNMMRWSGICATAWMLSGCVSTNSNDFTVGLALTQNGIRPLASTSMGGMHIMGEGVPLY